MDSSIVKFRPRAPHLVMPSPNFYAPAGASPTCTYLQQATSTANQTTYTFASQNLGAAAGNRKIIAVVYGGGGGSGAGVNSVTINGVSATEVVDVLGSGNVAICAIYIADVPTGTSGDVVVTFSTGQSRAGVDLFHVVDLNSSTAHATASDTTGDPVSTSINVPAGGFCIAGVNFAEVGSATWTGLTERSDASVEAGGNTFTAAMSAFVSAQTPLSISCDHSTSETRDALAVASWGN